MSSELRRSIHVANRACADWVQLSARALDGIETLRGILSTHFLPQDLCNPLQLRTGLLGVR